MNCTKNNTQILSSFSKTKTRSMHLDTFQTYNFKNVKTGDILLDVSSNIWSEYSVNNWNQIGNINIVTDIRLDNPPPLS